MNASDCFWDEDPLPVPSTPVVHVSKRRRAQMRQRMTRVVQDNDGRETPQRGKAPASLGMRAVRRILS